MLTPFNFFIGVWKGSGKGQPGTARKGFKVYGENHFQRVLSEKAVETVRAGGNLIQDFIQRTVLLVASIGSDSHDDDDIRLQKSLLVICAFPFMIAGVFWGLLYIFSNEPLAGAIPLSYSVVSLLSIIYFGRTREFQFFRFSQLTLILLLPFFLMAALGGFFNGSAVLL